MLADVILVLNTRTLVIPLAYIACHSYPIFPNTYSLIGYGLVKLKRVSSVSLLLLVVGAPTYVANR